MRVVLGIVMYIRGQTILFLWMYAGCPLKAHVHVGLPFFRRARPLKN
jgi:hypothetical protein